MGCDEECEGVGRSDISMILGSQLRSRRPDETQELRKRLSNFLNCSLTFYFYFVVSS